MPLECNSDEYPNGIALHLSGQLTFDEMDEFRRVTDLALSHTPRVLALDLAGIRYVASAGISALLNLRKRTEAANTALRLFAVPKPIVDLLTLTRLDAVFPRFDTAEQAMA